jgi:hypothetical protein
MRAYFLLAMCVAVVTAAVFMSGAPAQDETPPGQQQKLDKAEFESQFPLTDKNKPEPADPQERAKRRAVGKKYDNAIQPVDERADTVVLGSHWASGLQALPVSQSQAIIVGEVTGAEAHLSNDQTGVYSEFTIRAVEVLKNDAAHPLTDGSTVVAERAGGRIRFPSGCVVLVSVAGQHMPRPGRRYVLFLKQGADDINPEILTGYELKNAVIEPLDNPSETHPILRYKGAKSDLFLADLRAAIAGTSIN